MPFIIYVILGAIALVLFLVVVAAAVLLDATTIVLVACLIIASRTKAESPTLKISADIEPDDLLRKALPLAQDASNAQYRRQILYDLGYREGISLTKGSGETRFDGRSKLGRQINEELEVLDERIPYLLNEFQAFRKRHYWQIMKVGIPYLFWRAAFAIKYAIKYAIPAGILFAVVMYFLHKTNGGGAPLGPRTNFPYASGAAPSDGFFTFLHNNVIATFGIAFYVVLFFMIARGLRNADALGFDGSVALWKRLRKKWNPKNDISGDDWTDDFKPSVILKHIHETESGTNWSREEMRSSGPSNDEHDEEDKFWEHTAANDEGDKSASWRVVLGVSPWSTAEDVKTAYREAIRKYHTDRVVGLGDKIQAVAEEETKRLNVAYEEAKRELGF